MWIVCFFSYKFIKLRNFKRLNTGGDGCALPGAGLGQEGDIEDIELLGDGMVDLGEIAVQYLALALNPYPTSGSDIETKGLGENVAILSEEAAREQSSPFAVLKKNPKK